METYVVLLNAVLDVVAVALHVEGGVAEDARLIGPVNDVAPPAIRKSRNGAERAHIWMVEGTDTCC